MLHADQVFATMLADPDYLRGLDFGSPRTGHPEGSIRAHIAELERNLATVVASRARLGSPLSEESIARLKLLIHAHDILKVDSVEGLPIDDPRSHASLAAALVRRLGADEALCAMVQGHDVPYAIWRKGDEARGQKRLEDLLARIPNLEEFALFQLIDNITAGKDGRPAEWFIKRISPLLPAEAHIEEVLDDLRAEAGPTRQE
jgi:hypothetical protein